MRRPLALTSATAIAALVGALALATPASANERTTSTDNESATWTGDTLSIQYSWSLTQADATWATVVDGAEVDRNSQTGSGADTTQVVVPREAGEPAADIQIRVTECDLGGTTGCLTYTDYSSTVEPPTTAEPPATPTPTPTPTHKTVKQPKGTVSAVALLGKLHVDKETHASSYRRSKFKLWVDANRDGENTRAEVLKAESKRKVTENSRHTVKTGRWTSSYDGKTFTVASKLDIDHLVPLQEAWTSGAYKWSAKKRTAYANDIGYAASLIAVSKHANRSKGDKEPNAYLPPKVGYRCAYVRNYIAVKSRWALSVNAGEKTALSADLSTYCATNPWVKKPGKPNLTALAGKPKGHGSGGGSGSGGTHYAQGVHPGAFCAPAGAYGYTSAGTLMQCRTSATDSRNRWRRA